MHSHSTGVGINRRKAEKLKRMVFAVVLLSAAAVTVLLFWAARRDRSSLDERRSGGPTDGVTKKLTAERRARTAPGVTPARSVSIPFSPAPEPGSLPTDPEDPDYDPYVLVRALNMDAKTLFEQEKRDPIWAPAVETRINKALRGDFGTCFPSREPVVKQECRLSTCIATVEVPDDFSAVDRELASAISQWAQVASSVGTHRAGNTMTFAMTIARDRRDLDQLDTKMREDRRKLLDDITQGPEPPKTDALATAIRTCYLRIAENSKR